MEICVTFVYNREQEYEIMAEAQNFINPKT